MQVLIIGCGYVGLTLGAKLASEGHTVTGVRRSPDSETELRKAGIKPLLLDFTREDVFAKSPNVYDWVVNCVSSSKGTVEDYRTTYLQGMKRLIQMLSQHPPTSFVYTSSTSVYGQIDGSIVSENSAAESEAETAQILLQTEKVLLEAVQFYKLPGVILRLAGIYGPNRGYWFRQFMSGHAAIEGDGQRFLNMIHRDDAAGSVITALQNGKPGEVYNVADDHPVTQLEFFRWLSQRLGRNLPPVVSETKDLPRKRAWTNKRVSNSKLKNELGYVFKYPTFREGYEQEIQRELNQSPLTQPGMKSF
jgi:nucleoside-diphosphate-sugar epimerase